MTDLVRAGIVRSVERRPKRSILLHTLEEGDLLVVYGKAYRHYQQRVSMLLPQPKKYAILPETDAATRGE